MTDLAENISIASLAAQPASLCQRAWCGRPPVLPLRYVSNAVWYAPCLWRGRGLHRPGPGSMLREWTRKTLMWR